MGARRGWVCRRPERGIHSCCLCSRCINRGIHPHTSYIQQRQSQLQSSPFCPRRLGASVIGAGCSARGWFLPLWAPQSQPALLWPGQLGDSLGTLEVTPRSRPSPVPLVPRDLPKDSFLSGNFPSPSSLPVTWRI